MAAVTRAACPRMPLCGSWWSTTSTLLCRVGSTVTRTLAHGAMAWATPGAAARAGVRSPPSAPCTSKAAADRAAAEVGADDQVTVDFCHSVPWPWYDGMRLAWLSRSAARKLIIGFAPDVIHIHSPLTLGRMARRVGRRLGIPVVYTNHYLPQNARPARHRRSRAFDAGKLLCLSRPVRQQQRSCHGPDIDCPGPVARPRTPGLRPASSLMASI